MDRTARGIDFHLEAIAVVGSGDGFRGWAVGRADRILVAGKSNGTPYLTSLDATTRPNGDVKLEFAAEDDEGNGIEVARIEICNRQKTELLCEDLDRQNLLRDGNRWSLVWEPDATETYAVGSGDRLQSRVSLRDEKGGFSFTHATAVLWEYRVWHEELWSRYPELVPGVLAVAGVLLLYVSALLGIFLLHPVWLLRISRILSSEPQPALGRRGPHGGRAEAQARQGGSPHGSPDRARSDSV